ncbi:MAG: glucosaminidase domain-containing protein [Bacteroidales bacterium]|nr:glucosaminidase domain-containing protein [Bacteroidales bacterium]MCF8405670.1 glucosaminidase domain-containing protein [Bacteroidales bacterium]
MVNHPVCKSVNHLLLAVLTLFIFGCNESNPGINIQTVSYASIEDIYVPVDSLVAPVTYDTLISLEELTVDERKEKFIALILPSILITRYRLEKRLNRFKDIVEGDTLNLKRKDRRFLKSVKSIYRTNDLEELEKRLHPHPVSIVLAQAAIESAWGTSRFFTEANNVFGVWSFDSNESRIAANSTREGSQVYLKKYNSLLEAVEDYFLIIARGPYGKLRNRRVKTNEVSDLLPGLINYSELNEKYIAKLEKIIRKNDLTRFDHYQIDPQYID